MPTHLSRLQHSRAPHPTLDESRRAGKALRRELPRTAHRERSGGPRDPLAVLEAQNETRLPHLVPLRTERMLATPFTFYRGTAGIMAADLEREPVTGLQVVGCGDAHLSNFGLFASPQRTLVFDLNDFDEAATGPWEWDVKRLVTSVVIGAREAGFDEPRIRSLALTTAAAYREGLREMMRLDALGRYFARIDTDAPRAELGSAAQKVLDKAVRQARRRTSAAFVEKVSTRAADGTLLIVEDPPVLTHLATSQEDEIEELFELYRGTVPADIAELLSHFTLTDVAMRVVGVGSVGTRCYILILTGPSGEPLVLQVKEAQPSVYETFGGVVPMGAGSTPSAARPYVSEGQRVVDKQRILQAVSDPFLGHLQFGGRDFYVRQFRDMKGSIETAALSFTAFASYGSACGTVLARAHAQSFEAPAISGYLGRSSEFDEAVVDWSFAYAEQSLADFEALRASPGGAATA
ncbi:DUF2252 domain-containing protein [Herbiconiux sp. YIM B11900]|uniref:DUF2252 domain-containing protein n=1 Tax=Herbiconiux sp. YIM B11900 TaxID=3404131 RepID=UPI003F847FD9